MQTGQILGLGVTGNSNNPVSAQTSRSMLLVELVAGVNGPLLIQNTGQPLVFGLGLLDPYSL